MPEDVTQTATETAVADKPSLTPDQQKIAAALDKGSAAAPTTTDKPIQPKVHKTIFKAPPGELMDKDFAVTDNLEDSDGGLTATTDKPATTTAKPTTEKPAVVASPETAPDTTKSTAKPAVEVIDPSKAKVFDYKDFSADETTLLRLLSNPAREFTAKLIRDNKRIVTEQPQAFYQHPEGFTLTPEYRETTDNMTFAAKERDFYRSQLINIRGGKSWYALDGFNKETGEPIVKGPYKPTEDADIDVSNALNVMSAQVGQYKTQQDTIRQQFTQRVKNGDAILQAERAKRFAWVNDPKLLEEAIEIPNVGSVTVKKLRDDFRGAFDTYHHSSPLMEMMCDMFAGLQVYAAKIRALEASTVTEKKLREDILRAEPSPDQVGKKGNEDKSDFSMEGLPD